MSAPRLSVVVTWVDGGPTLERCLDALTAQDSPPPMEILVPFDSTVTGAETLAERFPAVRFLDLGRIDPDPNRLGHAAEHERYDRRRAAGIAAGRGELIAMVEDRCVPRRNWARTIDRLHRDGRRVIGGAIEHGGCGAWNWAVYFCDFGRYGLPLDAGSAAWVSDVNVSYKRGALEQTRALWDERYHETTVHWALQRAGETLYLEPEMVVDQHRERLGGMPLCAERMHWGRLFASTRAREVGAGRRVALALATPLLPFLLWGRQLRLQLGKPGKRGRFLLVSPLVFLLQCFWCAGELWGYLRPAS